MNHSIFKYKISYILNIYLLNKFLKIHTNKRNLRITAAVTLRRNTGSGFATSLSCHLPCIRKSRASSFGARDVVKPSSLYAMTLSELILLQTSL